MSNEAIQLEKELNRLEDLKRKKATLEGLAQAGKAALAEAKETAMKLVGTDDLEKIREMFRDSSQSNKALVAAFHEDLNKAEAKLKEIEDQLG